MNLLLIPHNLSSYIQTCKTGDQLYSDTSPYKVSEFSLFNHLLLKILESSFAGLYFGSREGLAAGLIESPSSGELFYFNGYSTVPAAAAVRSYGRLSLNFNLISPT